MVLNRAQIIPGIISLLDGDSTLADIPVIKMDFSESAEGLREAALSSAVGSCLLVPAIFTDSTMDAVDDQDSALFVAHVNVVVQTNETVRAVDEDNLTHDELVEAVRQCLLGDDSFSVRTRNDGPAAEPIEPKDKTLMTRLWFAVEYKFVKALS